MWIRFARVSLDVLALLAGALIAVPFLLMVLAPFV